MGNDELKRQVGQRAADLVASGCVLGLGSGSTARYATLSIGERLRTGDLRDVVAIPTSEDTAALAREVGIPLTTLEEHGTIDMTIDGADEVDPGWNVIKGLGGCLLREKVVAYATRHEVIVVDESKLVPRLGFKCPVPVEVLQFGWKNTKRALEATGARPVLRLRDSQPFVTDEGNWIVTMRRSRMLRRSARASMGYPVSSSTACSWEWCIACSLQVPRAFINWRDHARRARPNRR